MGCISYCFIAFVFALMTVVMMISCKTSPVFKKFRALLNPQQASVYQSIIHERTMIYVQGLVLGAILGLIVIMNLKKEKTKNKVCVFVLVALVTNILYYKLHPKSTYMLLHLDSQEQVSGWLDTYKTMKLRSALSILIGIMAYISLGMGCC